jgi:hypothetical protein
MNVGDLVMLDTPWQRVHRKIGIVVGKDLRPTSEWQRDVQSFSYEVLVDSEVWRVGYNELLEVDDWGIDEAG